MLLHDHPQGDTEPMIPEVFMNPTFSLTQAGRQQDMTFDMTFPHIPPLPNVSLPSGLVESTATTSMRMSSGGLGANSSSCDNLDIASGIQGSAKALTCTASGLSEMPGLIYRSESTPELTELARPSSVAGVLLLDSADQGAAGNMSGDVTNAMMSTLPQGHEFIVDRNTMTLPLKSDVKRSNLKKRLYTPSSSLTSPFVHRHGSAVENTKKSISFSSIVHFQGNPDAETENLIETSTSFTVPRANSETGPRPSLRDLFKRVAVAQEISGRRDKDISGFSRWDTKSPEQSDLDSDSKAKPWSPAGGSEGNKFSRALKNFRGKQMKGANEEQKQRFLVVRAEQGLPPTNTVISTMESGQTAKNESTFLPTDNEDTMTSLFGSEWAVQLRAKRNGIPPSAGSVSMASDDVFGSQKSRHGSGEPQGFLPEVLKNSLVIMLSGIYGIVLVVLGLVLPIAETYADPKKTHFFEIFYLYLYAVSMIFLVYVYTYLLRREKLSLLSWPKRFSSRLSLRFSRTPSTSQRSSLEKEASTPVKHAATGSLSSRNSFTSSTLSTRSRRRKIGFNSETSHHTGSFYLRVGVIGFGIGSMLHSGLVFGHYFEINHLGHPCSDIVEAIKPIAHLCFTFVQMYFIFRNSKMCVHKYKTLARFGLIHMSATNICVWLRSIVVETVHVIMSDQRERHEAIERSSGAINVSTVNGTRQNLYQAALSEDLGTLPEVDCHWDAMMGKIVEKSSLYLYPCTIEYSLVCACVLYVIWSNVGEGTSARRLQSLESASDDGVSRESTEDAEEPSHMMSVDCAGSSRGLFLGIFLFVFCVVCMVSFYVLSSSEEHVEAATVLGHISEDIVYILALIATAIAGHHMSSLHYSTTKEVGLEEILMLISLSGLGLFGVFSIVSGSFYIDTLRGGITVMTNVLMLLQAGSQATFILAALRASAKHRSQVRSKPGRQYVIFLLISNFALWAMNTFETQRMEHNVIQVQFYGPTAWAIFSHISVPLGIYFRFHSTVSLSTIWKQAWKLKHTHALESLSHTHH
ncbi:proton channel OtopLc-like [Biomphalaria glabrata]|uniref:Proton channel OtopLc-like n=1 Tax=Biomphalaria glabrata TaxID=6526 RepID=A0A9W2ZAF6_BIOGL|nr:proton channel OtopLc-like [Biomphalaria glabrata]